MSDRAKAANPEVFRWARSRAGLTLEDVADRLNKSPDDIRAWEEGEAAPTFLQLERLANSVYDRPVGLFFFPEPPDEEPLEHEFRTLPEADIERLPSEVRLELQWARALLLSIRELSGGENPAERQIWRDMSASVEDDPEALAAEVREYLGVDLHTQQQWSSTRDAMSNWRRTVENVGVFVFKDHFGTEQVSGFCVYDPEFPVIVVNNMNTFTRQIFTLFHELAHVLFGLSGITPDDLSFAERISNAENRKIETICNELAAEILVPSSSFPLSSLSAVSNDEEELIEKVATVAASYQVSREVVMRRLLERGVVDRDTYLKWAGEWSSQRSHSGKGGNYYYNQRAYLGQAFLSLAFSQYYSGDISIGELADHLGMKARTVQELEARDLVG